MRLWIFRKQDYSGRENNKHASSNSTITELGRSVHRLEKYSRRECIEIAVIPRNIPHAILEDVVIKLLNKIDVNLTKNDLVVRRTLAISNRTIIKVLNGKHIEQIMNNKSKLEGMNIIDVLNIVEASNTSDNIEKETPANLPKHSLRKSQNLY